MVALDALARAAQLRTPAVFHSPAGLTLGTAREVFAGAQELAARYKRGDRGLRFRFYVKGTLVADPTPYLVLSQDSSWAG